MNLRKLLVKRKLLKIQAPKTKSQTNPNNPNSKFQTNDPPAGIPNDIIAGKPGYENRCDITKNFGESFGHWILEFGIYL